MRKHLLVGGMALGILVAPIATVAAHASPGGFKPITATGSVTGADDTGTCNNTWAEDDMNKTFMLTSTQTPGVYNLQVWERGTFVTNGGSSPGACESGTDNDQTVTAGITGKMHAIWDQRITTNLAPNHDPDCSANACSGSGAFLTAVFGSSFDDSMRGAWSWEGHYQAGPHGHFFDTNVNWPLNDRGDITG